MPDRQKVIKSLKLCVVTGDFCGECPYDGMESCIEKLHDDALSLLKEQDETKTIICQKCGDEIEIKWSLLIKPGMEAITQLNTQKCVGCALKRSNTKWVPFRWWLQ